MSLSTSHFDELHLCTGRKIGDLSVITEKTSIGTYEMRRLFDGWSVFFTENGSDGECVRLASGFSRALDAKEVYLQDLIDRLKARVRLKI